jgi:hypothetical protein
METHAVTTDVPALARLQKGGLVLGFWGLLLGAVGAFMNLNQFFQSWLVGFLIVLGLSLGALALLMLQHMSGGQWGLVGRRVFEAASRNLPFAALAFVPLLFGLPRLYMWAQPALVATDHILQQKAPYLNVPFFIGRAVLYFAIWIGMAWLLNKWSAGQDRGEVAVTKADTVRFRFVSAPGLLVYVITLTFASIDWVMSLDPHWYSTIFGLIFVAGQGLAGFAFVIVILAMLGETEPYATYLNPGQFLDLGKLLLAFTMLWAYFSFSQFLIIWAGRLGLRLAGHPARALRPAVRAAAVAQPEEAAEAPRAGGGLHSDHAARRPDLDRRADVPARRLPDSLDGPGHPDGSYRRLAVPVRAQPPQPADAAAQRPVLQGGVRE